jgi:outer membrane receptor protein involved in Fe transport
MELPPPPDEIVVTAPRLPEAPGARAFSVLPIDPEALERALRIDDALRSAPGVSLFRRTSSAVANPTIQGLSVRASAPSGAGRTLVLLEGAPLNDPFGGWVIWGAVPPDALAGVDIVRGAGAGPYGAGALLGTVQLTERDGEGAAASAELGERRRARISGFALTSEERFSFMAAAHAQREDGFVPVRTGRGGADAPLWFEGAAAVARLGWRGDEFALSARLGAYDEERGAGLIGAQSRNTGQSFSLALARPQGPLSWRVQAWATASDLANTSVAIAPDRSTTTPANDQVETPALGWGANAALRWSDGDDGAEIGADIRVADGETRELFRFQTGQFTRSRIAGGETLIAGLYGEAWRQSGPLLISGGVRFDEWRAGAGSRIERDTATDTIVLDFAPADNTATATTARLGVRRDIGDAMFVRGAAYSGFRPPTLNELHRPFRVGNDVTEANSALQPERLIGVDAAIGGERERLRWSVGAFATRLEEAIVNVTLGAGPGTFPPGVFVPAGGAYRQRVNAGAIDALGLEADAQGQFGAVTWRSGVNVTHARMQGGALDGLTPAQSPRWSATAALSWDVSDRATVSADLSYESARFEDDLNSRRLSPATTLDLRADYTLSQVVSVYAALDNAFDAAAETAETADGVESFAPPRTLRVGLRLTHR